jgi:predicted MFS family arabinose efflux permease
MMVMPLGPYFAEALGFAKSHVGFVGMAYTAAAAVSGLAGAFFLDRFDRRRALLVSMFGLSIATALGGLAVDLPTLLLARVLAGLFGGPATSVALAIIADIVPTARRGHALGTVMTSFSVASVLGVPIGLTLADFGGWRMPFFGVALLGAGAFVFAYLRLPSLRIHLDSASGAARSRLAGVTALAANPTVLLSFTLTALAMTGGFILIPTIAAYLDANLAYPKAMLKLLYFSGGLVTIFTIRRVGRLVDRFGSFAVGTLGTVMLCTVIWAAFIRYTRADADAIVDALRGGPLDLLVHAGGASLPLGAVLPMMALFVGFMFSSSFRNVAYSTLTTKVPRAHERAAFMSIQSAVQHFASAGGALLSSVLLTDAADGAPVGMRTVAWSSIGLAACVPVALFVVERAVVRRARFDLAAANQPSPGARSAPPLDR